MSLWLILLLSVVATVVGLQVAYLIIKLAVRDGILAADRNRRLEETDRRRQQALAEGRRTSYRLDPPE
jgi:uncharacterized membrane protein YdjX (TVP38/TMEM64 family)